MRTLKIIYRHSPVVEPKTSATALIRISKTTKKRVDILHDPIIEQDLRWIASRVTTYSRHVTVFRGEGWSIRLNKP